MLTLTETIFCQLIHAGKGEAIRIRAILRSLIPIEDLVGVISIPFSMPSLAKGKQIRSETGQESRMKVFQH